MFSAPGVVNIRNTPAPINTAPAFIFNVPRPYSSILAGVFCACDGAASTSDKTTPESTLLNVSVAMRGL